MATNRHVRGGERSELRHSQIGRASVHVANPIFSAGRPVARLGVPIAREQKSTKFLKLSESGIIKCGFLAATVHI